MFRYIDFEKIDRVPHFTGAQHRIDCRQDHSGNGDNSPFLAPALGATLELTEAQYNDIMNAEKEPDLAFKAFKAAIDAGCFKINGNCYIPDANGESIAEFDI